MIAEELSMDRDPDWRYGNDKDLYQNGTQKSNGATANWTRDVSGNLLEQVKSDLDLLNPGVTSDESWFCQYDAHQIHQH